MAYFLQYSSWFLDEHFSVSVVMGRVRGVRHSTLFEEGRHFSQVLIYTRMSKTSPVILGLASQMFVAAVQLFLINSFFHGELSGGQADTRPSIRMRLFMEFLPAWDDIYVIGCVIHGR